MKILVIGNGIHANKRIIPSLKKIDGIKSITIADRSSIETADKSGFIKIINYEKAFEVNEKFDLCIIATPPYNHRESLCKIYSKADRILIEKPISNNIDWIFSEEFKNLYTNKPVYESLMYFHHPAWNEFSTILNSNKIIKIVSEFSVPHLDKNSYRYKKNFGGGSLNDQGLYPLSLASQIIKKVYELRKVEINSNRNYEVDLSGQFEMVIDNQIEFIGKWGLGKDYKNYVKLFDKSGIEYQIEFFYSKPDSIKIKIVTKNSQDERETFVNDCDQFENMYKDILKNKYTKFLYSDYENLIKRYSIYKDIVKTEKSII